MEEAVLERAEKEEADRKWNGYHERNGQEKPTEKQKAYILALGRTVGLLVNVDKIPDRQKAGELIQKLQRIRGQMNGNSHAPEIRDKRIAYGMATKLLFKRYLDQQRDPLKWKRFWQDVEGFYREYERHQETAILEAAEGA